jgi:WD40 repeat protein
LNRRSPRAQRKGKTLAACFFLRNLSALLFALAGSQVAGAEPAAPPIVALAVSPDGTQLLAASQSGVQVLSLPKLEKQQSLDTQLVHVHDLAFSPDGAQLALAGGAPAEHGRVELLEWPAGRRKATLQAGGDLVYQVAWNADGMLLAAAGADRKLRILPADGAGAKVYEVHSAAVLACAWLAADDLVLSAGVDQSIRVLEPATGNIRRSLDNHTAPVRDLAVRPGKHDGPVMVASAGADRTVRLWQPAIGRLVRFVRLPSAPTALAWTPSGSHVLAACEDGRLRAVDPATVEVTEFARRLDGWAHAVAALPDGGAAALAGAGGQLRIVPLDAIKP